MEVGFDKATWLQNLYPLPWAYKGSLLCPGLNKGTLLLLRLKQHFEASFTTEQGVCRYKAFQQWKAGLTEEGLAC